MTTKLEEAAKQDFTAEVSEWIEAFDDVVAADWEQGSELLEALRQRAREAGVPTPRPTTIRFLSMMSCRTPVTERWSGR
jgi:pyruvate dehydrogenase E1 component